MNNQSSGTEESSNKYPPSQSEFKDPWNTLEINLDNLRHNYKLITSMLPAGSFIYAVLKSDAYEHGIIDTARTLSDCGCDHFAVETPQEGIVLRNAGITDEILIMNPIPLWMSELTVRHELSPSVIHESILDPLNDNAERMNKKCNVHLNVNVGLNRLGIPPSKLEKISGLAFEKKNLIVKGLFGQPIDSTSALASHSKLKQYHEKLSQKNLAPELLHFANSTTLLAHPETIKGAARIGILLYGVLPPEQFHENKTGIDLKPVMKLTSRIVQLRELPPGSRIGYRSKLKTTRDTVIATLPIGYSHGLDRKFSKGAYVMVNGMKAPFVGVISMNASTIDVTDIPGVKIDDEVLILGGDGKNKIDVNELADQSGTIAAELMMRLGKGVSRHHVSNNAGYANRVEFQHELVKDSDIHFIQTYEELSDYVTIEEITNFLHEEMKPYEDDKDVIHTAIDYAISSHPNGGGFILLAIRNSEISGCIVNVKTQTTGFIPSNVLVFVCVKKELRNKGIGEKLLRHAINYCDGDVKLHASESNPAVKLYKRIGFENNFLELRYHKEEK